MNNTANYGTHRLLLAAIFVLLPTTSWADDRCAQFNLKLPDEFGGTPTQKVESGLKKNGKPLLPTSISCEFSNSKGRVFLHMRKNAKADSVAVAGRVMALSNNGKQPQKLEGAGDEALYARNSSVMRKGNLLYQVGWKWANNNNAVITAAQTKIILSALLDATPAHGPQF